MATGIICEYNPFHNGHIYHLNEVKKLIDKDEEIVLILSGNFTQRGNISLIEKYDKAYLSLLYGVDLVILLPFQFATQSSDFFAKGAISLLNELKCDKLIFGSESNDIEEIKELAKIQLENKDYELLVKEELAKGINYPTATSNALEKISNKTVRDANDLLALSYVKEIIKNNYNIKPISIKRTNNYNSLELTGNIDSARSIRNALKENKDITLSIPKETNTYLNNIDEDKLFLLLKYKITSTKDLSIYQTVDEGLDNKIRREINNASNLDDLINLVKSKRYTYNKLSRMFTHILCSFTKEENKEKNKIEFINVLGFSKKGQAYLNKIKKETDLPIITNISKGNIDLLDLELRVDEIYKLITNRSDNLYSKKPVIK